MICSALLLVLLAAPALAHEKYLALNPNGAKIGVQALGHEGSSDKRNAYGLAFAANDHTYTTAAPASLCAADADGDGQSNGFEMGDECCFWSDAANCSVPLASEGLSMPGDAGSVSPRPPCNCSADAARRCACCSEAPCAPGGGGSGGGGGGGGDDDDDDEDDDDKWLYIGGGAAAIAVVGAGACVAVRRRKAAAAAAAAADAPIGGFYPTPLPTDDSVYASLN